METLLVNKTKNIVLLSIYVIAMIPKMFYNIDAKMQLSLFIDDERQIGWVLYYYTLKINFIFLAYCLHYNKGIDKRVTRLLLIISGLDLLHLITLSGQGFGMVKIGVAIGLLIGYEYYIKHYGKNK